MPMTRLGTRSPLRQHRQHIGTQKHPQHKQLNGQFLHLPSPHGLKLNSISGPIPVSSGSVLKIGKGCTIPLRRHRHPQQTSRNHSIILSMPPRENRLAGEGPPARRQQVHKNGCKSPCKSSQSSSHPGSVPPAHRRVQLHWFLCKGGGCSESGKGDVRIWDAPGGISSRPFDAAPRGWGMHVRMQASAGQICLEPHRRLGLC